MKKKLLFINGHLNVGGVEKSLLDVLSHLDYQRYDVDLLLLEELGDYAKELPSNVKVILRSLNNTQGPLLHNMYENIRRHDWFSLRMRWILLLSRMVGQRCMRLARGLLTDQEKYDCVIGYRSGICTQVAAYAVNAKKRITWWHHGEFNVSHQEYAKVTKKCDTVVTVSESCAEMLAQEVPALIPKLHVIPNMIDQAILREKAGSKSPYSQGGQHWVTVCRISPEKHVENILYAANQLKAKKYSFHWHIVGDGELRNELEKKAVEMGVKECVHFEGSKENPYPFIKYAQLYIHPSYVESQGLTILEALALGTPCIVTKSRGPCEFIQSEHNGLLVDQSPEALEKGIELLLEKSNLQKQIQKNTVCPACFLPDKILNQLYDCVQ